MLAKQTVDTVRIHLCADRMDRDGLTRLRYLLVSHPGECKVMVHMRVEEQGEAVIGGSDKLKVGPTDAFVQEVTRCFGKDCLEMSLKTCLIEPQSPRQWAKKTFKRAG